MSSDEKISNSGSEAKSQSSSGGCFSRFVITLIILGIVGFVAGKFFFPSEKVRDEIVQRVSEALDRTVELDDVSFSIISGPELELRGFRIFNPENFPGGAFISVDKLNCGLKILPLLKKQFVFTHITLDHPVIRLHKNRSGEVNYNLEVKLGAAAPQTPMGKKETVTAEEAAFSPFAFDWAEINHGDLVYIDDSTGSETVLNNFSLETRLILDNDGRTGRSIGTLRIPSVKARFLPEKLPFNIELTYNAEVDFVHADLIFSKTRLTLNGIAFDLEATIRNFLDPISIFAKIKTDGVSLEPLLAYIPSSANFDRTLLRLSGSLSGEMESRIELKSDRTPYFSGVFVFNDLKLGYQNIASRLFFEKLEVNLEPEKVAFKSQGGRLSERPLKIEGSVSDWDDPLYDIILKGSYELSGLTPFLDSSLHHQLLGRSQFDIGIKARQSKWYDASILGIVSVDSVYYTNDSLTSPLERLDLRLTFKKNNIIVDSFYARYPGVEATLTGSIKNGLAHLIEPERGFKKPFLNFVLKAPLVNYDILLPEEEREQRAESGIPPAASPTGDNGRDALLQNITAPIFLPDIEAGGKVVVDTFIFSDVRFEKITADVGYKDGVISFDNGRAMVYDGSVTADGKVDINDMFQPAIDCEFSAKGVEANQFMTQFANLENRVFGTCDVKGNLKGQGSKIEDFIGSLDAEGRVEMQNGKLVNFEVLQKLAAKMNFKTFEEEEISNLLADLKVRQGHLILENTNVITRMGDWLVNGDIDFLQKGLALKINLYLSQEMSKKIDLFGGILQDDKGRVRLSFSLGGTYQKPIISDLSTDNSVISKKVEEQIKKKAGNLLKKLFDKN